MGRISVARPKISPVSQMMDPTAFPRAIPGLPCKEAKTETTISGNVVPRLIMVAPMMTLGMPQAIEMRTAVLTRISADLPRTSKVTRKRHRRLCNVRVYCN